MKPRIMIDTTKVTKLIDPVDVSAYKIKSMYLHRNDAKKAPKPDVGKFEDMRDKIKRMSVYPNIYN